MLFGIFEGKGKWGREGWFLGFCCVDIGVVIVVFFLYGVVVFFVFLLCFFL